MTPMPGRFRLVALAMLLPGAAAVSAADWQSLGKNAPLQAEVFVGEASPSGDGSRVTAQMLVAFDTARPMKNAPANIFQSVVQLRAIDCATNSSGVISETYYPDARATGNVVWKSGESLDPKMEPATGTSFIAVFTRHVCEKRANAAGAQATNRLPGGAPVTAQSLALPLGPDEELIVRVSWARIQDARAKHQDPGAVFGTSKGEAPLRGCEPKSKTYEQFRECYRIALAQQAIDDAKRNAAVAAASAPPPPVPSGGVSIAAGAQPIVSDAEWSDHEKNLADACVERGDKCFNTASQFLYAHWPAPKATAQELAQPCRRNNDFWASDTVRQYANSGARQQLGGPLLYSWVGRWADHYFPGRASIVAANGGCSDDRFVVSQWQRAVGRTETGRISNEDVDDFVSRWAPVLVRNEQRTQKVLSQLDAAAHDKAKATEDLRARERAQEAALYANGPQVFGVTFGALFSDTPQCKRVQTNPAYDQLKIVVDQTCIEPSDYTLRFPANEQPGWVRSNVKLLIDSDTYVVGMDFAIGDEARALQAIDAKFGTHQTNKRAMHRDATVLCNSRNDCVPGMPAADWTDTEHVWDSDKLAIRVASAHVTIRFKPYDQVRRLRAQVEEEIGREARERKQSQEKQF